MYDDIAGFIHSAAPAYNGVCTLRLTGFDNDWLEAQFRDGADGELFEVEGPRSYTATVDGNPESPKNLLVSTAYANLEVQDYGSLPESYRWFLLKVNNRTEDDYARIMEWARVMGLPPASFQNAAPLVMDVEQWLRALAFQALVWPHIDPEVMDEVAGEPGIVRPEDGKVLYLPWDWDSCFLPSFSTNQLDFRGNAAKLLAPPHNQRQFRFHLHDILTTTYQPAYLARWAAHYGALAQQDLGSELNFIDVRSRFIRSQLTNEAAAPFAITNNGGLNFTVTNGVALLSGTAPLTVHQIAVNGVAYPVVWLTNTAWSLAVPLPAGVSVLELAALGRSGAPLTSAVDSVVVTNTGPPGVAAVVINEWMADNAGPYGLADPADGLFQDWFELFNPNLTAVNLGGHYLTDNLGVPAKWRIPTNTVISPRGFLLVWADNNTNQNRVAGGTNVDLHAAFNLSNGGEALGLFAPDGATPISTVTFGPQAQNISQGRFPDGQTNGVHSMPYWTPRAPNLLASGPVLTEPSLNGGLLTLRWSALPGRAYRVEYRDSLGTAGWMPLGGDVVAADATAAVADIVPTAPAQRFYRVVLRQ
jgi:hypothetical protein